MFFIIYSSSLQNHVGMEIHVDNERIARRDGRVELETELVVAEVEHITITHGKAETHTEAIVGGEVSAAQGILSRIHERVDVAAR